MALPVTNYNGTYITVVSVTSSSIWVVWSSFNQPENYVDDPAYNVELWRPNDSSGVNVERTTRPLNDRTYTFTGLSPATTYQVKIYANRQVDRAVDRVSRTTPSNLPDPPSAPTGFRIYSSSENSASFTWNAVSGATSYSLEVWRGSSLAVPGHYGFTGTTRTVGGLSPNISYMAKLYGNNAGGSGTAVTFWFELGYDRPSNFGWTGTKARGRSYNLVNGRFTNLISYDEFTAFKQRINDFRRYKSLSAYTFSNISRGAVLTAALYNELNDAIAAMSPPTSTPGRKSTGTSNLPALLNGLVSSLNSIN